MSDTNTAVASAPSGGGESGSTNTAPAPTTFADAFARDASPASPSPDQRTTPPAAAQPGTEQGSPQQDDRSPFIPRQRFDEVNNSLKELKAWKEQRAWADQVSAENFREMQTWFHRAAQDPVGFAQEFINDLNTHPVHSQALRSLAAKALASGRGQQALEMPQPDVDITNPNGQVIGQTYSDKQLAERDKWLIQQVMTQVDQKYAPVVKTHEEVAAERAQLKAKVEADHWIGGFGKEMAEAPGFQDHKTAIGQEVVRMLQQYPKDDPRTDDKAFLENLTLRAYLKIVPRTLQERGASSQLASLQQKAAASVSVNPGSAAPSSPKRIDSFHDSALQW